MSMLVSYAAEYAATFEAFNHVGGTAKDSVLKILDSMTNKRTFDII